MSKIDLPHVMIDAMIIIYALAVEKKAIGPSDRDWEMHVNAHDLFSKLGCVAISALAWSEIRRSTNAALKTFVDKWEGRIFVLAATDRAAERAAELYKKVHGNPKLCQRCFGLLPVVTCVKCQAQRSSQRVTDDIMTVAIADVNDHIHTFYSDDHLPLHLAQYCKNVSIKKPPKAQPFPLPLFPQSTD